METDAKLNVLLSRIADQFGTPCFVYDFDHISQRVESLKQAFKGQFQISYAVKTNPNSAILRLMSKCVDFLDVSSAGEITSALDAGWLAHSLSFTGPGKRDAELIFATEREIGAIVVETVREALRLNQIAQLKNCIQPILIRISPARIPSGFGIGMAGKPTQFGIDEEELSPAIEEIQNLRSLRLDGFHIYCGTQCLNPAVIAQTYELFISLFRRFCEKHDIRPKRLIFGSGLGIPYYESDTPLVLDQINKKIQQTLSDFRKDSRFSDTTFILEAGRYLVGEAGFYLMRVISEKKSRGANICIMDGGMHHHLGAAGHLGTIIHRNYRMFKLGNDSSIDGKKNFDLFGPLCTSIDMLGRNVEFSNLTIGDVIAITCSGAYGPTASPVHFINHPAAREISIQTRNNVPLLEDVTADANS